MKTFNAVYDLRVLPASFDIAYFLTTAYVEVRKRQIEDIKIRPLIFYGETRRNDFTNTSMIDEINRRIDQIILPICKLLCFTVDITLIPASHINTCIMALNKFELGFPLDYNFHNPVLYKYYKPSMLIQAAKQLDIRLLRNSSRDLDYAEEILNSSHQKTKRPKIVFHERLNPVSDDMLRNTNEEWAAKLIVLLQEIGDIYVVPDYMSRINSLNYKGAQILTEGGYNLRLRSAIAEKADFNIFGPGGFHVVGALNPRVKYIFIGNSVGKFNEAYKLKYGFEKDTNIVSKGSYHQIWLNQMPSHEDLLNIVKHQLRQEFKGCSGF